MTLNSEYEDLIRVIAAADRKGLRGKLKLATITFDMYAAVMFLTGSHARWQSISYQPAQQLTGWIPEAWRFRFYGLLLIAVTAGILYANHQLNTLLYHWMSGIILTFYMWWTLMFTYAAFADPRAGLLAPGVFGFITACHALLVTTSRT